jgi:hypothetical protein
MRPALVALVLLVATACGASPRQAHRPATENKWPPVADSARAQWHRSLEQAAIVPVTLSKDDLEGALKEAAAASGVVLVQTHYEPLAGGSAEIVVQPAAPRSFAEAAAVRITPLLGPLARDDHGYFVTVVDAEHRPLLVLGWAPGVGAGGASGEGVAWQADGIRSSAIIGQPVTLEMQRRNASSNSLLQAPLAPALGVNPVGFARSRGSEAPK